MTDDADRPTPPVSRALSVGMLIGVPVGLLLGLAVFDDLAVGLVLGGGTGGVLGATLPTAHTPRR
ncbi:hypothetical protein [Streptomyces sp. BBFR102]|uniref:hypothetical protein n=1 Tax=Streptomyces sp. BBFR102 TaxID=3448171 RepID=UPI003F52EF0B